MTSKLTPVPKSCAKYYQSFDFSADKFAEVASEAEVNAYVEFVHVALSCYNIEFLGWAVAKPKYFETLAQVAGIGLLVIGLKDDTKVLLDVTLDAVTEYSRDKLDSYFEN